MHRILFSLRALSLGALVALVVGGLVACGSGGGNPSTTTSSPPPASGNSVTISGFSFSPGSLAVAKGTTVTWTNKDATTHTVVSDDGVFNSGDLAPNGTFSYTFNNTGTFPYHCSIHAYMTGTIIVQ